MRRIPLAALLTTAAGCALVAPSGAFASITVGETFVPDSFGGYCVGVAEQDIVPTGRASGPSYAVPSAGVLTSWSFQSPDGGIQQSVLNMRVFRPTPTAHQYTVVADGSPLQTIQSGSGLNTFPTQIPVTAGDFVGLRSTAGDCAAATANGADTYDFHFGAAFAAGDTATLAPSSGLVWDIAARLEADADHDGFGDETQDQCPTDASTPGACPVTPVTTAPVVTKKKCKKKKHKRYAESAKKKHCKKKKKK
ncbi:MAG: hypothetical protein WA701_02910 [Solirubrobacterales bacterium]